MGHNIMHEVYPENVDQNKVQRDWDNYAAPVVHGEWIRQEGNGYPQRRSLFALRIIVYCL